MLELIEQNQLIEQHGTQNDQLGAFQAFDRYLASPFEYILEQTIERFDGLVTQQMEDTTYFDPGSDFAYVFICAASSLICAVCSKIALRR